MNIENREWKNAEVYTFNPGTGLVDRGDFLRIDHDQRIFGNRSEAVLEHALGGLSNRILAGVEYIFNRQQRDNNSPFGGGDTVDFLRPVPGNFNSPDPFSPQRRTKIGSLGLYAEDLLKLTESIKLALGYRHDISRVKSFDLRDSVNDFQKTFHGDSWRVGLLYDIFPTVTLYGQWSGAAEPPSQIVTLSRANRDFKLTKSTQWEIGLKGTFWDDRVQTTLAFFDLSRRNMLTRDTSNPDTVQQIGKQSSYGVEFALGVRPNRQWSFDGNFAWVDAQFDKFTDRVSGAGVSRKGNRPNDVPEITANIWTFYRPFEPLNIGLGIRYVGDRFADRAKCECSYQLPQQAGRACIAWAQP
ncbi:MAG: TonB-dependent receptor [Nitrosomonas sp.]|nr:TonB-dependent receptor [Nitrosomonas sp.]